MSEAVKTDERVREMSKLRQAMIRPELGGIVGTVAVFTFFHSFCRQFGDVQRARRDELVDGFSAIHDYRGGRVSVDDRGRI